MSMTQKSNITPSLLLGLITGVGISVFGAYLIAQIQHGSDLELNTALNKVATTDPNFVTAVVQKDGPAVVRIDSSRVVNNPSTNDGEDFFSQFFGFELPSAPKQEIQQGTGSGFVINKDGRILTNAHVVNGFDTVKVTLKDGRSFKGKVLGQDPVTDVAVVKIDASNLPIVKLGSSARLQPGEWAIAIGNPLGLDNTVTVGIVSATGRSSGLLGMPNERVNFIQTDAAINPGNSGGPLLNQRGEVIGMNTAILKDAQGLGFAIPIDTAERIAQQLVSTGKVEHPYLGIQMLTLTPELKQMINREVTGLVDADQGVVIARVVPGSPADKASLKAGDVIRKIDNHAVNNVDEVQQLVEKSSVGSSLPLVISRGNQTLNLNLQLEALPVQANQ